MHAQTAAVWKDVHGRHVCCGSYIHTQTDMSLDVTAENAQRVITTGNQHG